MTTDRPCFYARYAHDQIETKGVNSHSFGHKIDREPGTKPDGVFAEWSWDGDKLTVTNDRYGLLPLYYCSVDNEIYLSTSIRQMLVFGAPNDLDHDALAVFLRVGLFIGNDTPFEHIKILPPNASFTWAKGKLTVSANYPPSKPIDISEDDAIDKFIQLFRRSIQRRLPTDGKFILPLSGGKDSRHILLELHHLGFAPECTITLRPYPPYYDEDIRIARILSETLHITHIALERKNSYLVDELRALEITSYGSDEHAWFLALADYIKDKTKVLYDGIAGDMLSGASGHLRTSGVPEAFHTKNNTEMCKKLFEAWGRPNDHVLRWMLDKDFLEKVNLDRAIEHLSNELKKHTPTHNPLRSFYFWNRTIRKLGLSPYAINAGIEKVYSPYLDHDLFDFLISLPTNRTQNGTLHAKAIKRAYPQYANIPYEQNDSQKISTAEHRSRFSKDFSWYGLKNNVWSSRTVRGKYLAPRMLNCLVSKKYQEKIWWLKPPLLLYLFQLEKLQQAGGRK